VLTGFLQCFFHRRLSKYISLCGIIGCNSALYAALFGSESEAAFSNYRLWESVGFVVAFAYSFYLCAAVKLYILTSLLLLGMLGYLAAEYIHRREPESMPGADVLNMTASCT